MNTETTSRGLPLGAEFGVPSALAPSGLQGLGILPVHISICVTSRQFKFTKFSRHKHCLSVSFSRAADQCAFRLWQIAGCGACGLWLTGQNQRHRAPVAVLMVLSICWKASACSAKVCMHAGTNSVLGAHAFGSPASPGPGNRASAQPGYRPPQWHMDGVR